jgi:hypothetical protein
MDAVSITGLILGIASGLVLFIKGIRKCKISKQGIDMERDSDANNDLADQQAFTLKLLELAQTFSKPTTSICAAQNIDDTSLAIVQPEVADPPKPDDDGVSITNSEVVAEIKQQMTVMLDLLNKSNHHKPKVEPATESKPKVKPKTKPKITQFVI